MKSQSKSKDVKLIRELSSKLTFGRLDLRDKEEENYTKFSSLYEDVMELKPLNSCIEESKFR